MPQGVWHHQDSSAAWAERVKREKKQGSRVGTASLEPQISPENLSKITSSALQKVAISGSNTGNVIPVRLHTAKGTPSNKMHLDPPPSMIRPPPASPYTYLSEYKRNYSSSSRPRQGSSAPASLLTKPARAGYGTQGKVPESAPGGPRPLNQRPPLGLPVKPPTPLITKPVHLPTLRNPHTGLLNDAPLEVKRSGSSGVGAGGGMSLQGLDAFTQKRPGTSASRPSTSRPTTSTGSTSYYYDDSSYTSGAPSRKPPMTPIREPPDFVLPMHSKATKAPSEYSVDIVDRVGGLGGQVVPMVLNVEDYEQSSLEVLQMELERSDDEDELFSNSDMDVEEQAKWLAELDPVPE